ncbi:MAG TPA: type II toxin-antitoxin system VapC family toxin [Gammaproteobacteria bacterium]
MRVAEPKAAYANRPTLVADASVIAAALFGEESCAEAEALLHARALHAPHLLDFEIAGVGVKKIRRGKQSEHAVAAALRAYGRLPIERHAVDAEVLVSVAQRYGLTAHDAAYLCVAERLAAPLATFDEKLAAAARIHLGAPDEVH